MEKYHRDSKGKGLSKEGNRVPREVRFSHHQLGLSTSWPPISREMSRCQTKNSEFFLRGMISVDLNGL